MTPIEQIRREAEERARLVQDILDKNVELAKENDWQEVRIKELEAKVAQLEEQLQEHQHRKHFSEEYIEAEKKRYQEIIVQLCERLLAEVV